MSEELSSFEKALPVILKHEGGYVNDPRDSGGATNYGVSLRYLLKIGDLDGDGILEGDFDQDGDVDGDDIRAMTPEDAAKIYKSQWWDRYHYGLIADQAVATKVFDLAVNMGPRQAHKLLQRALAVAGIRVAVDGVLGPITREAVNEVDPEILLKAYRNAAAGFYRRLNQPHFLKGWLRRAYA